LASSLNNHNGGSRAAIEREHMLAALRRQIGDERVIDAMAMVPRVEFVPRELRSRAYDDRALPLAAGQTISQPLIVAIMTEALELRSSDRVLEVGTGSGYQTAVLSRLSADVVTVERVPELRASAETRLRELGYGNVRVYPAGETLGRPEDAPYDAIIVTAGAPRLPRGLVEQLAPGGRLVIPVGDRTGQQLVRARKTTHGVAIERLGPCAFVPLIGDDAWPAGDAGGASRRLKVR
jgi:protein-L-isoaspartate(D-aspartate) O-methyltransferase